MSDWQQEGDPGEPEEGGMGGGMDDPGMTEGDAGGSEPGMGDDEDMGGGEAG